ncbi:hypothetical protein CRG98_018367 [Punica granatum]|uniref:Uncharacterized protein n=1 Tax=Punica granatum TaxID=22663 RepID=A0A2I0JY13_PUNGR|nr:hypothetical protein CRG98_018367 [Punica granatum]
MTPANCATAPTVSSAFGRQPRNHLDGNVGLRRLSTLGTTSLAKPRPNDKKSTPLLFCAFRDSLAFFFPPASSAFSFQANILTFPFGPSCGSAPTLKSCVGLVLTLKFLPQAFLLSKHFTFLQALSLLIVKTRILLIQKPSCNWIISCSWTSICLQHQTQIGPPAQASDQAGPNVTANLQDPDNWPEPVLPTQSHAREWWDDDLTIDDINWALNKINDKQKKMVNKRVMGSDYSSSSNSDESEDDPTTSA